MFQSAETLGSKSEMERKPEIPASNRDESLFIPAAMHEESRGAPRSDKGDLTSLRRHERSPRSKRNSRGTSCHNSRQTMKFSPAHLRRPFYPAAFPKKAHVSLGTQKGPRHALRNSISFPRYPSPLESNAEFSAIS